MTLHSRSSTTSGTRPGFAESLTWSQLYRRSLNVAHELSLHGSPEDRAVILAPQGLDYIAAFLGALQAGFYAVPLPVPQPGAHDDRVSSVLEDTSPSVILTTSVGRCQRHRVRATADRAGPHRRSSRSICSTSIAAQGARSEPVAEYRLSAVHIGIHPGACGGRDHAPKPGGQFRTDHVRLLRLGVVPPDATIVSWLPFYHDMGLVLGVCAPILAGIEDRCSPARWLPAEAGPVVAVDGKQTSRRVGRRRTSPSNWR